MSRGLAAVSVAVGMAGVGGCLFVSSAMFARLLLGGAPAARDDDPS